RGEIKKIIKDESLKKSINCEKQENIKAIKVVGQRKNYNGNEHSSKEIDVKSTYNNIDERGNIAVSKNNNNQLTQFKKNITILDNLSDDVIDKLKGLYK